MTDSNQDRDQTPDQTRDQTPDQPKANESAGSEATESAQAAQSAPAGPTGPAAPAAGETGPTEAYGTDAFGRPAPSAHAGYPGAPQPQPTAAYPEGYPTEQYGSVPPQEPARRKGSVALIAALAIGALVGGASGAGVTALVLTQQGSGVPVSEAQGPGNVVVNNSESVTEVTAVAAKSSPSVVTISVASGSAGGTGSGVILSEDGFVLTNTHVVTLDGAVADAQIQVTAQDGTLYKATVVGTDPVSDLAVIKLTGASGLQAIEWADSSKLNVGDTAIAIGAPLGLAGTVTNGIVSALNRSITVASSAAPEPTEEPGQNGQDDGQNPFDFWNFDIPNEDGSQQQQQQGQSKGTISLPVIQTDAAINPGNSGGALLNGKGELIGINVAIANAGGGSEAAAGSIGVGFAIPSNLAKRISEELIDDGKATHGLLGASVTSASSDTDSATVGALIKEISRGGGAEKAGMKPGDVVTNFNGVPITDANDLTAQVRALAAGSETKLTYVRDGKSVTVSVTLGELTS